jgi:3-phenylpropionate/cinnamic acid dioxygenase small subunit
MADRATAPLPDIAEIGDLIVRLARATDDGDIDEYAELMVIDATWQMPGGDEVSGRDSVLASARERRAAGLTGPGAHTRHLVSMVSVSVEGDRARARSSWQYYSQTTTSPSLSAMGSYADEFVRTSEGWRFTGRLATVG